ncbi:Crp/Fnr family transcriptional regulator [Pontibacter lucknowensis]|uniref:cAMP-binding domain of CRP or a regulatory subunit of cAMP-dependent protein kinases n=1 Tax=Pontibacter lucknowensis TaxID=1077936 RepID=A0A1N7ANT9_9BACT|nr:Crp/Fnr family transcriptional regulator [Pontibacter lucknowensis]SIR40658.1 cAMP-binding domain of CRP or a regulatory subunit of cAMP-dependent protein kinases [Pontibacter lucknowensis]
MQTIGQAIRQLYPISDRSFEQLTSLMQRQELPKGHILFREGQVSHKVFFIERGIARAFCYRNDQEVTFWFGVESDLVFSYYSYVANKPGYETVELLENSVVQAMDLAQLQELYLTNIELANWGRKLAEYELIKTEERFMVFQFQSATERYKALLQQNPALIQRVPLNQIASYLGVTQVTLSRIRAEVR